ncbi:GNAT family protein [Caenispirillum bisanense]|uniref:GNAT family N-acetyltransferase n=1 Tax=Caenispirillum bisanense TaxID=414052 RepID=UPI0031D2E1CE
MPHPQPLAFHPVTASDLPDLESWFADADLARRLEAPTPDWLAHVSGGTEAAAWVVRPVGGGPALALMQADRDGPGRAVIAIAVRRECRHAGLGRRVLDTFADGPGSAHAVLVATVEPDNLAALRCLQHAGFRPAGQDDDGFLVLERHRERVCL